MPCPAPVIFLIFRRPELTAQVFEVIRQAQPKQLLVVADGPRDPAEAVLCEQARAVTERIDWDCQVFRNYAEANMGCRDRVSSGISWAFGQVEEAIILEDDCLPHPSFFTYCSALLERYRHDERVMAISGDNFQNGQRRTPYSYYFSKYPHCWGWATWRRAWRHWQFKPEVWLEFRDSGLMPQVCGDADEAQFWHRIFDRAFLQGQPNTWGYPWTLACWAQGGLTALPEVNLVSNIGFAAGATHTNKITAEAGLAVAELGPLVHSPFVVRHREADRYTFDHHFCGIPVADGTLFTELKQQGLQLKRQLKLLISRSVDCLRGCLKSP